VNGIDPENAVVKLCVAGVEAEQAGDGERASALYRRAWEARTDALEASMAAHYLARVQADAATRMRWNRLALEQAFAFGEGASSFLPSLHLNVGHCHEEAGQLAEAAASYQRAAASLEGMDAGVADSLRPPIDRARRRVTAALRPEA
jgi:tetratricopeptide (TPR) repeat protein